MKIKFTFFLLIIILLPWVPEAIAQNAPTIQDGTFTIDEFSGATGETENGLVVGTVSASDADGDVLSYAILSGNINNAFDMNSAGEIVVVNDEMLDFEEQPVYTLTIQVSDDETPAKTATATITINLNDILAPNDFCTNAITVGIGETIVGSSVEATEDWNVAPDCGSNRTNLDNGSKGVWYRIVGNGEIISVSTCSGNKYDFSDTALGVYRGSCLTGLICVAGNEDADISPDCGSSGYQARLKFPSEQGVEYFVIVDGFEQEVGSFDLTTSSEPSPAAPANDHCQNAEALTVFAESAGTPTNGDNAGATNFTGIVGCDEYATINDVWYTFNSGPNVRVGVTATVNTAGYLNAALYDECGGTIIDCSNSISNIFWDVEPNTNYRVQVWNNEENAGSFTILLNDGPNTAPEVNAPTVQISKFSPTGTILEVVDLVDDDEGHPQLLSFSEGNDEGVFAIDEKTGEVTIADGDALAASSATSYQLTVKADDQGPGSLSATGTITVNIIENAPPSISAKTISIDENPVHAALVTNVEATDADGDNLSYQIIEGNSGSAFSIDTNGDILVNNQNSVDFEVDPEFSLKIKVTDDGPLTLYDTATVTITINDINDAPDMDNTAFNISQNSANAFSVGMVDFSDDDEGQNHTFVITAGNTDNIFTVDPTNGEILVDNSTNLSNDGPATYNLTIEVVDDGSPAATSSAQTTVNVFNNNPPEITSTSFTTDENISNGVSIGTLAGTDTEGDNLTFSLEDGGEGVFSVNANGNIVVANTNGLDFESNTSFNLLIKVQDDGDGLLSSEKEIQIDVNDVNEKPIVDGYEVSISASVPDGFDLGKVEAEDPENDVLSFSIEDGDEGNVFNIDAATGQLTVGNASLLDPMTTPWYSLTIKASDGEEESSTTVDIIVYANDFPQLTTNTFEIEENSENGTLFGQLTSDDIHPIIEFELLSDEENKNEFFVLDEKNGELKLDGPTVLDHETNQQFAYEVVLTDGGVGNLKVREMINILVTDVNEFTPVLGAIGNKTTEQAAELTFTATATDEDASAVLTYTLDDTSTGKGMNIDATTGAFTWTPAYNQLGTHTVEVTVNDGSFTDAETITVEVAKALGLEDPLKHGFSLYPNPAVNAVDLSLDNPYTGEVMIRVLDLAGKELLRKDILKTEGKLLSKLDISVLGAGIYLVELRMKASEKLVHRIIKE